MMNDLYRDYAAFYDLYVGDWQADLPYYLAWANRASSPILEIGAGTGRLTLPLARADHEVIAVDASASMLERLRSRLNEEPEEFRRRIEIVHADACSLALHRCFGLILVPFYTFNYFLMNAEQSAALEVFSRHLAPGGALLLDVFLPLRLLRERPSEPILKMERDDPVTGFLIRGWNRYSFDEERQIETRTHRFEVQSPDGSRTAHEFTTRRRYFFLKELTELLSKKGFIVEAVTTGYGERAADERSEQMTFALRRDEG